MGVSWTAAVPCGSGTRGEIDLDEFLRARIDDPGVVPEGDAVGSGARADADGNGSRWIPPYIHRRFCRLKRQRIKRLDEERAVGVLPDTNTPPGPALICEAPTGAAS